MRKESWENIDKIYFSIFFFFFVFNSFRSLSMNSHYEQVMNLWHRLKATLCWLLTPKKEYIVYKRKLNPLFFLFFFLRLGYYMAVLAAFRQPFNYFIMHLAVWHITTIIIITTTTTTLFKPPEKNISSLFICKIHSVQLSQEFGILIFADVPTKRNNNSTPTKMPCQGR